MKNISILIAGLVTSSLLIGAASTGKSTYQSANPPEIHNIGPTEVFDSTAQKVTITGPLKAENSQFGYVSAIGPAHFETSTASSVRITGSMQSKDSRFSKIEVTGSFDSDKTTAQNLYVTGSSTIKDSTFITAAFNGRIKGQGSAFQTISAKSDELEFSNSKIETLTVELNQNHQPQTVYLSGNTQIDNIRFESGNGRVVIEDESVKVANIQGGNIEKKI